MLMPASTVRSVSRMPDTIENYRQDLLKEIRSLIQSNMNKGNISGCIYSLDFYANRHVNFLMEKLKEAGYYCRHRTPSYKEDMQHVSEINIRWDLDVDGNRIPWEDE